MVAIGINVTQEDIDNGRAQTCMLCPIALAVRRATNASVSVTLDSIKIFYENHYMIFINSLKIQEFICRFDVSAQGRPFFFLLEGEYIQK